MRPLIRLQLVCQFALCDFNGIPYLAADTYLWSENISRYYGRWCVIWKYYCLYESTATQQGWLIISWQRIACCCFSLFTQTMFSVLYRKLFAFRHHWFKQLDAHYHSNPSVAFKGHHNQNGRLPKIDGPRHVSIKLNMLFIHTYSAPFTVDVQFWSESWLKLYITTRRNHIITNMEQAMVWRWCFVSV